MAQTVIGIFERNSQAQEAVTRLGQKNFDRKNIDVAVPEVHASRADITDDYILGSSIGRFFTGVFSDNEVARNYTAMAQRGVTVVVHTENYIDAERAASILDECGAINVNEHVKVLEDSMTRSDRKSNLKAGSPEPNTPSGEDLNVKRSSAAAAKAETPMSEDSANGNVTAKSRIVDQRVGDNFRFREEHVSTERTPGKQKHQQVDEGNIHKGEE